MKRHILVADPFERGSMPLRRLLELNGHQVTVVSRYREAIDAARRRRYSILISEISFPDGSGCDLMRELSEGGAILGIALTSESGYRREALAAGFATCLQKPVRFATLLETIDSLPLEAAADPVDRPTYWVE